MELLKNQIICKRARYLATDEIRCHMQEQKEAYIEDGMEENKAEQKAVEDMGDPIMVGKQLNKVHKPKIPWSLMGIVLFLALSGFLLQKDIDGTFNGYQWCAIGLVVMFLLQISDYTLLYRIWSKKIKVVWLLIIMGSIVNLKIIFGINEINEINGYTEEIFYGSVLLVPLLPVVLYACKNKGYRGMIYYGFAGIGIESILLSTSNGSRLVEFAALICFLFIVAIVWDWFGIGRKRGFILLGVLFFLVCMFVVILIIRYHFGNRSFITTYQMQRLKSAMSAILGPQDEFTNSIQYQFTQVKNAMNQIQWIGGADNTYLNEVYEPMDYLCGVSSDFILTYVAMKYGLLAALGLMLVSMTLAGAGMFYSLRQNNYLGKYIGLACNFFLLTQTICYSLTNFGIMDLFLREALPFVSAGNKMFITFSVLMGINLSVFYNGNLVQNPVVSQQ